MDEKMVDELVVYLVDEKVVRMVDEMVDPLELQKIRIRMCF